MKVFWFTFITKRIKGSLLTVPYVTKMLLNAHVTYKLNNSVILCFKASKLQGIKFYNLAYIIKHSGISIVKNKATVVLSLNIFIRNHIIILSLFHIKYFDTKLNEEIFIIEANLYEGIRMKKMTSINTILECICHSVKVTTNGDSWKPTIVFIYYFLSI